MPDGKGNGGGGFGARGQIEHIVSTPEKEERLPLQMVKKTTWCNAVIFAALTVILLLVGRWWPTVLGLAFAVWSGANLWYDGHRLAAVILSSILAALAMLVPPELMSRAPGFWYAGGAWVQELLSLWWVWSILALLVTMTIQLWRSKQYPAFILGACGSGGYC